MSTLPEPIKLKDGRIVLYKMRNSGDNWFARFKTDKGWRAKTTGTNSEHEAANVAYGLYNSRNSPLKSKSTRRKSELSFEHYADIYKKRLSEEPQQKPIYDTYRSILKNWILPYFGKFDIDTITDSTIEDYWRWCGQRKQLAKDTVDQHHTVLRAILKVAIKKGAYPKDQFPVDWKSFNKGYDGVARPSFTLGDYRRMHRALRYYHKKDPPSHKAAYLRKMMREYALILANAAFRPGEEMNTLKWRNVDLNWVHPVTKKQYVRIHVVKGKEGPRPVIARHCCRVYLDRLAKLTGRTHPDDYLFCMPNGKPVRPFYDSFRRFLIKNNLRIDISGEERTLYSLRHFYISCQILYKQVPLLIIAKNACAFRLIPTTVSD